MQERKNIIVIIIHLTHDILLPEKEKQKKDEEMMLDSEFIDMQNICSCLNYSECVINRKEMHRRQKKAL